MHAGEDLHRHVARVLADELLVDVEDAAELDVELLPRDVRQIEVHLPLAVHAEAGQADLEDLARGDVADGARFALVALRAGHPHASALAARRLRHQAQLVGAGNRRRVDLDELSVGVVSALLVGRRGGRAGVDDRVRGPAEDDAGAAGREHDRGRGERLDLHRVPVQRDDPAARLVRVTDEPEELPRLVLADEARDLMAAHLLVERVEELLAGRRAGERRAVVFRAAEPAKVEQAFGRPVEHHAHPVEQVDDRGRGVAHRLDGRLVGQEVAAVDRVVEMNLGRIPLTLRVDRAVDPALGADGMAPLDRNDREEVDRHSHFGRADGRHQPREAPSDDDDPLLAHQRRNA